MNHQKTIAIVAAIALAMAGIRARAAAIVLSDLNVANGTTYTVGSGDTLSVGSGASNYVGVAYGAGLTGTLDVSAAASFTANVGIFTVASGQQNATGNAFLGVNNTITAATRFDVGASQWDFSSGTATTAASGTTTIHTPLFRLGWAIANGTSGGTGRFTLGSGATLIVDGPSGGRTELAMGYDEEQYGRSSSGTMDLSGGVADLSLKSLLIGGQLGNGNTPGTLTMSSNASNRLDVSGTGSVVKVGYFGKWGGNDGGSGSGTLDIGNLGSNSAITSTDNGTALLVGYKEAGSSGSGTGNVTLGAGTLTITTTGTAIGGGGGTSNLNLNGTVLVAGASSSTWITGLTSARVRSGGVTFNTNGFDIGVPQALLTDGTSAGGGLTKSGGGTLTLSGSNTFTGPTSITGGRLVVTNASRLLSSSVTIGSGAELYFRSATSLGTAPVFSGTGATLDASGTMSGSLDVTANNTLAVGSTPLTVTGLTLGDNTTVRVESGGTSRVQINGNYSDSLGPHSLVTGFTASGTPYPFFSWTGSSGSLVDGTQSNWAVQEGDTGTKQWMLATSGSWNNPSAWDGFNGSVTADTTSKTLSYALTYVSSGTRAPATGNDVVIDPANSGITVDGPVPSATVRSVQVGGTNATNPTLALGSGTLTTTQSVTVTGNGTLDASSGGLVTPTLTVNSAGALATLANAASSVTTANVSAGRLVANAGSVSTVNLTGSGTLAGTLTVPQVNVTSGAPGFTGRATAMAVTGGGITTTGGTIGSFNHNTGAGTSTIGASTAVTRAATVSAGTVNFNSTVGSGTLTLPAASTGTVVVGPGAAIAKADFSAAAGTVNAANPLAVASELKLPGNVTATLTGGASFTAGGTNLANAATAREFTLSGGRLTVSGAPTMPVIGSGPTIWFDAAKSDTLFTDTAGTTQVTTNGQSVARWNSRTGGYYVAQGSAAARPTIAMNQAGGNPIVDFGNGNSSGKYQLLYASNGSQTELNFGNSQNTLFWIVKGSQFLLGNTSSYDYHRGDALTETAPIWSSNWADNSIRNGSTYLNKNPVNGTTTGLTGGSTYDLVDLITTGGGNARFNALAEDRTYRYGGMQYGEIVVFPGALSTTDRQAVENYLYSKWILGGGGGGSAADLTATSIAAAGGVTSTLDLGETGTPANSYTLAGLSLSAGTAGSASTTQLLLQGGSNVSFSAITATYPAGATGARTASIGSGSTSPVLSLTAGGTVSVAADVTLTIGSRLGNSQTGTTALVKSGPGTLVLSTSNSFTGGVQLNAGVVSLGNAAALGSSGTITFGGGALQYGPGVAPDLSGRFSTAPGQAYSFDTNGQAMSLANSLTSVGGSLTKLGAGRLTLSGSNTFSGPTTISGGTLALASGASLASSYIKAGATAGGGGTFDVTDLSGGLLLASGQKLGGHGTVLGNVVVGAGSFIAPGGSIGTLTQTGTQTWASAGTYTFEVTNAGGGAGTGWDLLNVDALQITASSGVGNQFIIDLQSLTNGTDTTAGAMSGGNWNANTSYQWKFVVANAAISSFDSTWFKVDTTNFLNTFNANGFSVARGDQVSGGQTNELYVVYAAVPEPGTLALAVAGGLTAAWAAARKRRRRAAARS